MSNNEDSLIVKLINIIDEKWYIIGQGHRIMFGYNNQLTVLAEECLELSQACLKIKRCIENKKDIKKKYVVNFNEKYFDVLVMLLQFSDSINLNIMEAIEKEKYVIACERIGLKP